MKFKILIPQAIPQIGYDYLLDHGFEIVKTHGNHLQAILKDVQTCDAILARRGNYPGIVMDSAPHLKVIGRFGTGVDSIDIAHADKLGIVVTNVPALNSNAVAEHTIFLIMSCAKKAHAIDMAFRGGNFNFKDTCIGSELFGRSLGLLGFGHIAQLVAKKATLGLGMKVATYSLNLTQEQCPDYVTVLESIEALFKHSDFISLHIPSTPDTKGLVNAQLFGKMKPNAYIINTARGNIISEKDLIFALQNKMLAGAGLDVFETEPPALDNPLFKMSNVIMTPHYAAFTEDTLNKMALSAASSIVNVLNGTPVTTQVNLPDQEAQRVRWNQ